MPAEGGEEVVDIFIQPTITGYISISAIVTDGVDTWRKNEKFMDYSEDEARALFMESLARENLTLSDA